MLIPVYARPEASFHSVWPLLEISPTSPLFCGRSVSVLFVSSASQKAVPYIAKWPAAGK